MKKVLGVLVVLMVLGASGAAVALTRGEAYAGAPFNSKCRGALDSYAQYDGKIHLLEVLIKEISTNGKSGDDHLLAYLGELLGNIKQWQRNDGDVMGETCGGTGL